MPIILALMLNELRFPRFKKTTQTILYLPHFLSWVIIGSVAYQLFKPNSGIINVLLMKWGWIQQGIPFLTEKTHWAATYLLIGVWQGMGWGTIIYLAAITGISGELYEAAMIDGASRFQRVIHVDIPAIMPMISVMLIMSIGGLMGVGYEKALLMQTDGNLAVSELIATYVYKRGLTGVPDQAYATAIGLFNSVINVVLLIIANTASKRFSENSLW
jgi:putative aldouronate transport system permease protein